MSKWEEPKDYNPHNPYHREEIEPIEEENINWANPYHREED